MRVPAFALALVIGSLGAAASAAAAPIEGPRTYRLYTGITLYVDNAEGKDFTVTLDLRDINLTAGGPREVLFKIYDPDGQAVVREVIPDDGVVSRNYQPRIGGWDHELLYYAMCYSRGMLPMDRWSAWSDPKRLETVVKRTFTRKIAGGKKGVYRMVLAGERDHYATITIDPALPYGVCGHTSWLHGHGNLWAKSFLYVPKGTNGLFVTFAEVDLPRTRRFKLTAPDGSVLFDGGAEGIFVSKETKLPDAAYDEKLLTLEVSQGEGDYLVCIKLQRNEPDYVGMGVPALLTLDPDTAVALKGGAIHADGELFWHPWQVRYHLWLKQNKAPDGGVDAQLRALEPLLRLIGPSDGRECGQWSNWGYAFGYYGCRIWRPGWLLSKNPGVPKEIMAILREGLIMGGDRLSFAVGMERVNGNAFAQIPVALWYCKEATGDEVNRQRFELFFERWRTEGWGEGAGMSKSGTSQEHFAHDAGYGSYIIDNWIGITWVPNGILKDTDDPRFRQTWERVLTWFSYVACKGANAYPWNARIDQAPVPTVWQNLNGQFAWKGEPGPDLTVSVNDGDEWFAARRKNYYLVTFHGRLAPDWMSYSFKGQLGFGGGIVCQLTVPGKGTVLNSALSASYGEKMDLPNWRNFHIHSLVGEMSDGRPLVAGVSEHHNAKLAGNVVTSSGEVRDCPVFSARKYTYGPESIDCKVALSPTKYEPLLSLWSHGRPGTEIREAYEMIPYTGGKVLVIGADGKSTALTDGPTPANAVVIDCGGYGARIELPTPKRVLAGANSTILIELVPKGAQPVSPEKVELKYRLVPIGS